jgi:hypothetical protein
MDRTALRVCVLAAAWAQCIWAAADEISTPHGYFVLRSARGDQPVPAAILNDPNVAGVSIRRSWTSVNPEQGRFDFGYVDQQIDAAARHGKKIMLHVDANGHKLPAWLLGRVQTYAYVERNGFAANAGQRGTAPVPWDEAYLSAWNDCIHELGQRYDQDPAVVAIHIGGPSRRGSEVFLPAEVVRLPGYSGQRILDVWNSIFGFYNVAFPTTAVVLNVAQPTPDRSLPAEQLIDIFRRSVRQPVVQHNSLSAKTSSRYAIHRVVVTAGQQGMPIGFQQLCPSHLPRHGGPLTYALQTAANAGADYLEIYEPDRSRITAAWKR